jgi:hypothetical protein
MVYTTWFLAMGVLITVFVVAVYSDGLKVPRALLAMNAVDWTGLGPVGRTRVGWNLLVLIDSRPTVGLAGNLLD